MARDATFPLAAATSRLQPVTQALGPRDVRGEAQEATDGHKQALPGRILAGAGGCACSSCYCRLAAACESRTAQHDAGCTGALPATTSSRAATCPPQWHLYNTGVPFTHAGSVSPRGFFDPPVQPSPSPSPKPSPLPSPKAAAASPSRGNAPISGEQGLASLTPALSMCLPDIWKEVSSSHNTSVPLCCLLGWIDRLDYMCFANLKPYAPCVPCHCCLAAARGPATSKLWGMLGESYNPRGTLTDVAFAG